METCIRWQQDNVVPVGSYRTYEEWKREQRHTGRKDRKGSYRTYEEWKHHHHWYVL